MIINNDINKIIEEIEKSGNEIVVFGHNDLDMLGSMLNIEHRLPNIRKKFFHTNYSNIPQRVDEIEDYIRVHGIKYILVPDVSFSTHKDSLRRLYEMGTVIHIDHHLYPDGFWDEFPNMYVVWDKSKCATLLCNEYLGNKGKLQSLDNISTVINSFDIWLRKDPIFQLGMDFNDFFWKYDIGYLFNLIVENEYRLPKEYSQIVEKIHSDYQDDVKRFEDRKLIHRAGDITICFVDQWFDRIQVKEMENGKHFVIGVNSYGIVRYRISEDAPYSNEIKNKIRFDLTGSNEIGHLNAFTWKIPHTNFDNVMQEIQKVVDITIKHCDEN